MRLSTKCRYGVRALLELALHNEGEVVPLKEIAARQDISLHYLEQIISALVSAGLLRSVRGPGGGVALVRPASQIRLNEVFEALEGAPRLVECLVDVGACPRSPSCATQHLWLRMNEAISRVLKDTTLQELAEDQQLLDEDYHTQYYI